MADRNNAHPWGTCDGCGADLGAVCCYSPHQLGDYDTLCHECFGHAVSRRVTPTTHIQSGSQPGGNDTMENNEMARYRIVWAGSSRGDPVSSYPYPVVGVEEVATGRLWSLGRMCLYSPESQFRRPALLSAPLPEETCDGPGYYDLFVRLPDGWYEIRRDAGTGSVYGLTPYDGSPVRHLWTVASGGWAPREFWISEGYAESDLLAY